MPITEKKRSAPSWRCEDCRYTFSGGDVDPDIHDVDDAHGVFSNHEEPAANVCPCCGGNLALID